MLRPFLFLALLSTVYSISPKEFQSRVQQLLDSISSKSNFSISVGYVDGLTGDTFKWGSGKRTPPGVSSTEPSGTTNGDDTMLLGSGTKPYTAAAIMRLVDENKLKLTDKASIYLDPVLSRMRKGTTFASMFGKEALEVEVGHLLRMESGIADFDVPSYDNKVLVNGYNTTHTILETLDFVASFKEPNGCTTLNCTWVCPNGPGTCVSYSSTSFVLAGLVLLAHAPPDQNTWETYNQKDGLGLTNSSDAANTHFPLSGSMEGILTVGGLSISYGAAEIYKQDASILGWTCGNGVSSALDAALFEYNLLSPYFNQIPKDRNNTIKKTAKPIVSLESLHEMLTFKTLDTGWAKGLLEYGAGIM
jgi:hypothetical protein